MEYVLKTNNLSKSYKKNKALSSLTMSVPKGAIYGLVGKNGAGKTTLIRLICGLQDQSEGDFSIFDVDSKSKEIYQTRRRIGAIIEGPAIYKNMSAKDNLKQQYRVLGIPNYDGIDEILSSVGLGSVDNKKAGHFSLGMRQRLAIAIALCGNPDFLILDEPMNGLDPQGIIEIRELLLKLNREKQVTVLISSHILEELSKIATHYGFINNGSMVKEISAEDLEKAQRKCVRVSVNNITVLARVLEELNLDYSIVNDNTADIYGSINISELTLKLHENGCMISSIFENDETLESYFINLVGGGDNA